MGLSNPHTSPSIPSITVALGANWAQLNPFRTQVKRCQVGGGVRGKIKGFSPQSRRRMLHLLNQVPKKAHQGALWVDLTYPGDYPSQQASKQHLDAFGKRLLRKFPKASVVWRLELQKRGAPHYHLLVYGIPFLPKRWLSRVWYEIVGSGDVRHLAVGTRVGRVRSFRQAIGYASKYIAKCEPDQAGTEGRVWGVLGRKNFRIHLFTFRLSLGRFWSIKRTIRARISKTSPRMALALRRGSCKASVWFPSADVMRLLAGVGPFTLRAYCNDLIR